MSGAINITCDGWQAGNTDGYFAVTGHWIEEKTPTVWECKSALLGFTKVNNAHNGKRLGGALFKVLDRVGIAHKVFSFPFRLPVVYIIFQLGHVTCDNASNNGTMLQEFARLFKLRFKKELPWDERRIK